MATPSKHVTSGLVWLCLPMSWMSHELCPKLCATEPGVKWNGKKKEMNAPMVIKSASTFINHIDGLHPGYDVMRVVLYLCGLPLSSPQPQSYHERNIR